MTDDEREAIESRFLLLTNAVLALCEHVAPEFRTRASVLLKYFTPKEIDQLEYYLMENHVAKNFPTKEEFRSKIDEIVAREFTMSGVEDVLLGYYSDGLFTEMIAKMLDIKDKTE